MTLPTGVILYCGGGIMDYATRGRLKVALAVDNEKWPLACHWLNHRDVPVRQADLLMNDPEDVLAGVTGCDVLHGSPPCKMFSRANVTNALVYGRSRWCLLQQAVYAAMLRPRAVITENVPWLLNQKSQGPIYKAGLEREMRRLGYKTMTWQLDSRDFGSCQSRPRLYMIAYKGREPRPPEPTHGPGRIAYRTLRDAIGKMTEDEALADGCLAMDTPNARKRLTDPKQRLRFDEQCTGLTCQPTRHQKSRIVHPTRDRYVSVAEYKRCFDVPDYRFPGDMCVSWRYEVLGNGNPPMVFGAVLDAVISQL